MTTRYIPPGYLSIEQAILRFSQAAAPSYWALVPPEEQLIWDQTVGNFGGDELLTRLLTYLKRPDILIVNNPRIRYFYFRAATLELRARLFAGELTAYSFDVEYRFGRIRAANWLEPDLARSWADGVIPILESGFNRATGRYLFLYIEDVQIIEKELAENAKLSAGEELQEVLDLEQGMSGKGRNLKQAKEILRQSHKMGASWPALKDLVEMVRAFSACAAITRDEIDAIRKEIDGEAVRGRGRPRKNPEQE